MNTNRLALILSDAKRANGSTFGEIAEGLQAQGYVTDMQKVRRIIQGNFKHLDITLLMGILDLLHLNRLQVMQEVGILPENPTCLDMSHLHKRQRRTAQRLINVIADEELEPLVSRLLTGLEERAA